MRISDWSSDVCSSDLIYRHSPERSFGAAAGGIVECLYGMVERPRRSRPSQAPRTDLAQWRLQFRRCDRRTGKRSEEHTSELQSLMRISYAVFCLKKKNKTNYQTSL